MRGLFEKFPGVFVLFAEFKTAIERRQTAQFLHMAVAQHYDVPVISYADAVLLPFFHQVRNCVLVELPLWRGLLCFISSSFVFGQILSQACGSAHHGCVRVESSSNYLFSIPFR